MSLPLSRRIAQAALLVAAGATPLVAAGSASASQLVPQGTDLAQGISRLDGVTSHSNLKGEAHQLGQALGTTGAVLSGTALPAATDAAATAASDKLPDSEKLLGPLGHHDGSTTATDGQLAELGKLTALTPLGGVLPSAAQRSMPATSSMPGLPASPLSGVGSLPAPPTVTGVDKVVNAETLNHPVTATSQLAGQIPATSSLAGSLPSEDRLASALPATDRLTGSLPSTGNTLGSVPMVDKLAGQLPATQQLGALPSTDQLAHGAPNTGDLLHPAQAADALHLQQLSDQTGDSTHRLGGLPDLGAVSNLLGGLGGTTQHLPTVD
ncbi:hypothetical protein [Kitasatospora sp. NBC_01266]|uniref:hypothetical protein n=1 Tax=Kitasatospora sp. NBC_01266 TaxID=2903572 RepID=UPI002E319224|nr:hypothetical protein [Kitasatospora sp. NBC_01266]